ncbi:restriction endonuclease subunit S [Pseudacidovorax intermedius]|uniref:Restriction endonuclease subunit R n=1 Tax=Pseudacidovorax intermedius TaxID=433924 RepID=A0A147H9F3_9BURK|nr:restriction endonuclease subunit S [Pseudacidovorax intermedius]KTT26392.1 restriction endonuclease subunit R [Pseudacidovorax intermedius]
MKTGATKNQTTIGLVPKLRFPEFRDAEPWKPVSLGKASTPITERVGERKFTPVSISAGIGFVPQADKFGRDISGNQYQLYTLVSDGDFVYNKGNSLKFPQGCVYQLQGWGQVAAPNVFISFRLKDGYSDVFFQNCFEQNIHGKQLQKHITSGARSNGLLNISKEHFFGVEIPTPSPAEQQKIADCLSSLDEVIAAQGRKVEALKIHKKGLMQQLFPREGETQPRLRFPEFAEDWEEQSVENFGRVVTGSTPSTAQPAFYGGGIPFVSPADISDLRYVDQTKTTLTAGGFAETRHIRAGSTLFVCIGSTIGKVAQNIRDCATNQQINAVVPSSKHSDGFVYFALSFASERIALLAGKQAVPIINKSLFSSVRLLAPKLAEQQRIADCLSSLDALITAATQKLDTIKTHKQGLMQQLFPIVEDEQ